MKPIHVVIPVRVTIDADAWTDNYGVEGTNAIRKDVKAYVQNGVYAQLDELGVLAPADSYIDLSRPDDAAAERQDRELHPGEVF